MADSRSAWLVPTLLLGSVCILITAPTWLGPGGRAAIMEFFAPLCHQIPERSFSLAGEPLAVCHRCTGIYAGLLVGAFLWRGAGRFEGLFRFDRSEIAGRGAGWLLVLAAAPAAVDWGAGLTGFWESGALVQAGTGFWFGVGTGLLVTGGLTQLTGRLLRRIRRFYPTYSSR